MKKAANQAAIFSELVTGLPSCIYILNAVALILESRSIRTGHRLPAALLALVGARGGFELLEVVGDCHSINSQTEGINGRRECRVAATLVHAKATNNYSIGVGRKNRIP